jgi:hypothetical protein
MDTFELQRLIKESVKEVLQEDLSSVQSLDSFSKSPLPSVNEHVVDKYEKIGKLFVEMSYKMSGFLREPSQPEERLRDLQQANEFVNRIIVELEKM